MLGVLMTYETFKLWKSPKNRHWYPQFTFEQGLILPSAKTEKNPVFCIYKEIQNRQIFPVKQKKILHRFFGAASWREFCKFFMGTQL
jgi:hypothetical protein